MTEFYGDDLSSGSADWHRSYEHGYKYLRDKRWAWKSGRDPKYMEKAAVFAHISGKKCMAEIYVAPYRKKSFKHDGTEADLQRALKRCILWVEESFKQRTLIS